MKNSFNCLLNGDLANIYFKKTKKWQTNSLVFKVSNWSDKCKYFTSACSNQLNIDVSAISWRHKPQKYGC